MVSQKEQQRRAAQAADATGSPATDDLTHLTKENGITPEQIEQARETIAAVNLDELIGDTLTIKFAEWVTGEEEGPDGTPEVRNRLVLRDAHIAALPDTEAQLHAFDLYNQMKQLSNAQRIRAMAECVLMVWRQSEPNMTLPRLMKGLNINRISKLFDVFFKETSRQ